MGDDADDVSLSVRVTSIDYYLAPPLPALDVEFSANLGVQLKRVPVVRIFGASSLGSRKTCLHLHRIFPYLLVPAVDSWPAEPCEGLHTRVCQLAKSVEQALRENQRLQQEDRQDAGGGAGFRQQERQHVLKAQVVRAVPMYGCHLSERLFVKIFFLDPADVQKAAGLLMGGACMGHVFQPYQSHIPYILQAMADLNLVGMGTIELRSATFREPRLNIPRYQQPVGLSAGAVPVHTLAKLEAKWARALLARPAMVTNGYERMSVCDLEVDALASDVLNTRSINKLRLTEHNRGTKMVETLAYIWDDVRKHNNKIGDGGTLDVPLSSARSHSCTPMAMAAMFSDMLKAQAKKESCVSGEPFVVPPDERVSALALFKPISDFYEMDAQGCDPAGVFHVGTFSPAPAFFLLILQPSTVLGILVVFHGEQMFSTQKLEKISLLFGRHHVARGLGLKLLRRRAPNTSNRRPCRCFPRAHALLLAVPDANCKTNDRFAARDSSARHRCASQCVGTSSAFS